MKERMNLKDAQEMANMMRVIASEGSKKSWKEFKESRTKEEYVNAFAVLEVMMQLVEKEPLMKKFIWETARLLTMTGYVIYSVLIYMNDAVMSGTLDVVTGKKRDYFAYVRVFDKRDEILRNFNSPSVRLKTIRAQAKFLGDLENIARIKS